MSASWWNSDKRKKLPVMNAEFWEDPRFLIIDGELYAGLLDEYRNGASYSEKLGYFDGYRQKFIEAVEAKNKAVLMREVRGEYELAGLFDVCAHSTYGEPFECTIMDRIAVVKLA